MTIGLPEYDTLEESWGGGRRLEEVGGPRVLLTPLCHSRPHPTPPRQKIVNGLGGALGAKGGVALLPAAATNGWVGAARRRLAASSAQAGDARSAF